MLKRFPALTTLLVVIFLYSCNRNIVDLESTSAKGEVPQLGNLSFHFSKSLVPDSLLNQWDSTAYISFNPEIPGRFRWESPDQLVFSPSRPLPPATSFKAVIKSDVLQYSKFGDIGKAGSISFYTPELKLEDINAAWFLQDEQSKMAVPQVDLYFNYPVDPTAIREKLKLTIDHKPVSFSVQTLSVDKRISLRIQGITPQDKNMEAAITIAKGIVPKDGVNASASDIATSYMIPSPFNLVVNDISSQHDGLSGIITVRTSQQVNAENLSSAIKFDPAVKFSVETTDEGFTIKSEGFDAAKSYLLTLSKGLRGRIGGVLQEQYDGNIAFGELEPSIKFSSNKRVYLSGKGNKLIEMRITNVPKVRVIISKIYESNLLTAQRYGYYPKESKQGGNEEGDVYYDDYGNDLSLGDVIYEKEIDTRSLPQSGNSRLFSFNVEDRLPDFKGIYHIKIRSAADYWIADNRFISVSDLGLIAKEGRDKLFVFANSIQSAEPVSGLNVIVYGNNNQALGAGATNADGVAEIVYSRKEFAGFKPAMIIAKTADDFNYLPFNATKVNTSRFETGGKRSNSTGLDAFIYAERDIYRPGEKVNFSVVLRDRLWKTPGEIPLKFKFLLPNGKELKTFRKTLNEQGSAEGNIDLSPSAITGSYVLEVYTSNDVLLSNKNFSVEEFVPDRIKVAATLDKPFLVPGQTARLSINAVNFFGPPAANRNYEAEIQVRSKFFSPKKYSGYDFSISNQGIAMDKVVKEGKTDAQGNAVELYETPALFSNAGLLQANFYATVFDETGRPVSRSVSADIFTQPVFFGVADDGYYYYPLNQSVKFPVIALNKEEGIVSGVKANIKVIKHEYRTVLSKTGSYFRYESQQDDKLLTDQSITISGENSSYSFVPRSPGNYELRIAIPGAAAYVSKSFYSYGSWGGDNSSFEVNTEGNIDIETDKTTYKTGDSAKVLFKLPFSGRMLVTMETDKVISYQYVQVDKRSASVNLLIGESYLPNVYITATLIKPHGISDIPLTVAHGFQNIKVEENDRINKVEIVAAKNSRSRTVQQVTVKAIPGSYVTLAAVDNGVLQVSDFKTPDPYHYFYASRALEVDAYDLYPLLFPELRARLSSTGGDGEMDMQKRTNPMPSKRVQIVSYWSGIAKTSGDGQATFSFTIPHFSGQVRLMAVAYKDNAFGSAESAITVADPLVVSTALPRFLSMGDSLAVPVTITNTTNKKAQAEVTLRVSGAVKISGVDHQT
ncbi:MAG: MG2 domain-containing protein, partial [Flavitalea sp.]